MNKRPNEVDKEEEQQQKPNGINNKIKIWVILKEKKKQKYIYFVVKQPNNRWVSSVHESNRSEDIVILSPSVIYRHHIIS